jgi:hypothetical protein
MADTSANKTVTKSQVDYAKKDYGKKVRKHRRLKNRQPHAYDDYIGTVPGSPEREVKKKIYYDLVDDTEDALDEMEKAHDKWMDLDRRYNSQGGKSPANRDKDRSQTPVPAEWGNPVENAKPASGASSPAQLPAINLYPNLDQPKPDPLKLVRRDGQKLKTHEALYPGMAYDEYVHEPLSEPAVAQAKSLYPDFPKPRAENLPPVYDRPEHLQDPEYFELPDNPTLLDLGYHGKWLRKKALIG